MIELHYTANQFVHRTHKEGADSTLDKGSGKEIAKSSRGTSHDANLVFKRETSQSALGVFATGTIHQPKCYGMYTSAEFASLPNYHFRTSSRMANVILVAVCNVWPVFCNGRINRGVGSIIFRRQFIQYKARACKIPSLTSQSCNAR